MAKSSSRSSGSSKSSKMDNQMLYIGLAVVVVLLIAVFLYRNKKSEDESEENYQRSCKKIVDCPAVQGRFRKCGGGLTGLTKGKCYHCNPKKLNDCVPY